LTDLLAAGNAGTHIAPDRITLGQWLPRWMALLERKTEGDGGDRDRKRGRLVNSRTVERYEELMRLHVLPTLGDMPLQKIRGTHMDELYISLEEHLASCTVHHVHAVFRACLNMAVRKRLIATNPATEAEAPSAGESDHGIALEEHELMALVKGFEGTTLHTIVATAAFTGARRNEILALRWSDLAIEKKTLTICRAIEDTRRYGRNTKPPKTGRGNRTIVIDDSLIELLSRERDRYLRLKAGVPDGATVDLSLVRLPDNALIFPGGDGTKWTTLRDPTSVTKQFRRHARRLGFPKLRFHDLRGTHETILLNKGAPLHVVAARCGHDPSVLLRIYAKRTQGADVIGELSKNTLGKG
jgi:integrase